MDVCVVDWGNIPEWLTLLVAGSGIAVAINQLRLNRKELHENHKWNRKQLAATEANKILSELSDILEKVDKDIKYSERKITTPYTVEEIHSFFCKRDDNGTMIQSDDRQALLVDEDKRHIRTGIVSILNKFDYLAGGINNAVFDEEVIKKHCYGMMLKAYNVFKAYIAHLRDFYKRETLFEDLEDVVTRWEKEKSSVKKSEPTGS